MEYSVIEYIIQSDDELRSKIEADVEYREILKRRDRIYEKLKNMLSDEQKELFEKYEDNSVDELCLVIKRYFKAGMKVGVRLVAESMFD